MKSISTILLFILLNLSSYGQQQCNKLGAWLWRIDKTGFETYNHLADSLANLGIKRIYVKVADGSVDSLKWPELIDKSIPSIFAEHGIEAWAWSYNYPNKEINQTKALYIAACTGYKGYIVDVECQFDGKRNALSKIFKSFDETKQRLISEDKIDDNFMIYCTTWGNPLRHHFYLDAIDPYVDAYFAQTYLENWGTTYMDDVEFWIDHVNEEYTTMGATKPVHHIVSTEKGKISIDQINRFIKHAGEETSVWPIPGTNTSFNLWNTWKFIDWNLDFYQPSFGYEKYVYPKFFYPNPASNTIYFSEKDIVAADLHDINGKTILSKTGENLSQLDITHLETGIYIISILKSNGALETDKVVIS